MANSNISSVSSVNSSFQSLRKYADRRIEKLRKQYEKTIAENTYYKEPKVLKIVILIVISLGVFYWATLRRADLKYFDQFSSIAIKTSMVEKIVLYVAYLLAFYLLYKAVVLIYCMKLQRYSKRIDKIEKTIIDRINGLNSSSIQKDLMSAIYNNSDYDFPVKNDVGEMINEFYNDLNKTNKKAYSIRRIIRFAVTAIAFLLLYIFDFRYWNQNGSEAVRFAPFILILSTAILTHLFGFNLGEYLGKLEKPLGILAAAVSCLFIMLGMQKTMPGDFIDYNIPVINKCFIVVPAVALIGIAVSVWFSHYSLEIEKWQNGFTVPMAYGDKDNGNKMTMLIRGGISLVLAVSALLFALDLQEVQAGLIVGLLWYLANPLLKPRGSYIYTFFGRGKCIGNEIILFSLCIYLQLEVVHMFDANWLVFVGLAVVAHFASAFAASVINNMII